MATLSEPFSFTTTAGLLTQVCKRAALTADVKTRYPVAHTLVTVTRGETGVTFATCNYDARGSLPLSCPGEGRGTAHIPLKDLLATVAKAPKKTLVTVNVAEPHTATVTVGPASYTLLGHLPEDLPEPPRYGPPCTTLSVPRGDLLTLLTRLNPVRHTDTRSLCAIQVESDEEGVCGVATNGIFLGVLHLPGHFPSTTMRIPGPLIPAGIALLTAKSCADASIEINPEGIVTLRCGDDSVRGPALDSFPHWRQVVPPTDSTRHTAVIPYTRLLKAAQEAAHLKLKAIALGLTEGQVTVTHPEDLQNLVRYGQNLPARVTGKPFVIGVCPAYLKTVLTMLGNDSSTDSVCLECGEDALDPMVIYRGENPSTRPSTVAVLASLRL